MKLLVNQWIIGAQEDHIENIVTGERIKLQPRAMTVLYYLASRPNQVVTFAELIQNVWKGRIVGEHAIYRVINQIRNALDADAREDYIITLAKRGYKFIQPVKEYIDHEQKQVLEKFVAGEVETPVMVEADGSPQFVRAQSEAHSIQNRLLYRGLLFTAIILGLAYFIWAKFFAEKWAFNKVPIYSEQVPLTNQSEVENYPYYSKNGKYLVFSIKKTDESAYNLFLKNLHSGDLQQVTHSPLNDIRAVVTDNAEDIVVVQKGEGTCDIVHLHFDGTDYVQNILFDCTDNNDIELEIDAAGEVLYYTHTSALSQTSKIHSYLIRTGKRTELTNYLKYTAIGDHAISLSADGNKLAFVRNDNYEKSQLAVLNLQDEELTVDFLKEVDGWVRSLSWGQDEHELVFQTGSKQIFVYSLKYGFIKPIVASFGSIRHSTHGKTRPELAVVREEKQYVIWERTNPVHVSTEQGNTVAERVLYSSELNYFPTYANQSEQFAFVSGRSGSKQIWVREENGSLRQVSNFTDGRVIQHLAWSPDDQYIASHSYGKDKIYMVSVKTGEVTPLLTGEQYTNASLPTWSADGKSVLFTSDKDDDYDIYQVMLEGKSIKKLTSFGVVLIFNFSNQGYYYLRKNSNGLWHMNSHGDKEIIFPEMTYEDYQSMNIRDRHVYYLNGEEGILHFYSMDDKTKDTVHMNMLPQGKSFMSISPDESNVIYSDVYANKSKIIILKPH